MKRSPLIDRAKQIKMVIMDVDGVLTDGKMYFVPSGHDTLEVKCFNAQDGIGLKLLRKFGISTGIITGRQSQSAQYRARTMCMKYAYQGFLSKTEPLEKIIAHAGITLEEVAYIGDDLTDIPVMKKVGLAFAPANSCAETKRAAHYVTKLAGGNGAVREVCDLILKRKGLWKDVMKIVETGNWEAEPPEEIIIVNAR